MLTCGSETLGEVPIKRGIFQGMFMDDLKLYSKSEKTLDSLIQTVRIFSEDIGMQFGIDKCAVLVMKKGKIVKSDVSNCPMIKYLSHYKKERVIGI